MGVTRLDKIPNDYIRRNMQVTPIDMTIRQQRFSWFGHIYRAQKNTVASMANNLDVEGKRPRGRPKQRWSDTIAKDLKELAMKPTDALDRLKWRKHIKP